MDFSDEKKMSVIEKENIENVEDNNTPFSEDNKKCILLEGTNTQHKHIEEKIDVSRQYIEFSEENVKQECIQKEGIKKEVHGIKEKVFKVTEFFKKKKQTLVGDDEGCVKIPIKNGKYGILGSNEKHKNGATKNAYSKDEIEAANARHLYQQKLNSTQSTMNIEPTLETDGIKNKEEDNTKQLNEMINYEIANLKVKDLELKESIYYVHDKIEKIEAFDDFDSESNPSFLKKCKMCCNYFGPGWIVAIAYLDPGNLCSNLNAGLIRSDDLNVKKDYTGYYLLWIMIYGHLLGFLFQVLSMKIGHITGLDLASICHKEFNKKVSFVLYILVQIAVWGAHVQAIVGTSVALNLIFGISVKITIFYTLLEALIYSFLENKSTKLLENVLSFLIGILACCFFINVFKTSINVKEVFISVIHPRIPKGREIDALALLGSIISAHIFYLHTNLTSKKRMVISSPKQIRRYNTLGIIESGGALFLSCLTNCFIVLTFAEVDITGDDRRDQYNLFTAHEVMKKSFGTISMYIWSIGLLSSGNNSSFMCEYATKSVFEGFLNKRVNAFLRVLVFRFCLFVFVYLFLIFDKYSIDQLTNFINVIQVLLLPLAIVPLYKFCVHKKVLGTTFALKTYSKYFVLFIIILIIISNLILTVINLAHGNMTPLTIAMIVLFSLVYFSSLLYFFCLPIRNDYYRDII